MFSIIPGIGKAIPTAVLSDPRVSIDAKFMLVRRFQFIESIVDEEGRAALMLSVYALPLVQLSYPIDAKKLGVADIPISYDPINLVVCPRAIDSIPGFGSKNVAKVDSMIASVLTYSARLSELSNIGDDDPATANADDNDLVDEEEDEEDDNDVSDSADDFSEDEADDDVVETISQASSATNAVDDISNKLIAKIEKLHRFMSSVSDKPNRKYFTREDGEPILEAMSVEQCIALLSKELAADNGELSEAENFLRGAATDCITEVVNALTATTSRKPAATPVRTNPGEAPVKQKETAVS